MKKINFNKIIVGDIFKMFTEEEIKKLKNTAVNLKGIYSESVNRNNFLTLNQVAKEKVYRLKEFTEQEKNFIYANILFPSNEAFFETIIKKNPNSKYNYNSLHSFMEMIKYLKMKTRLKKEFTEEDLKIYKYCILYISELVNNCINIVIGPTDIEPIVTKIDELITTSQNLFEEYEQELNSPTKTRH